MQKLLSNPRARRQIQTAALVVFLLGGLMFYMRSLDIGRVHRMLYSNASADQAVAFERLLGKPSRYGRKWKNLPFDRLDLGSLRISGLEFRNCDFSRTRFDAGEFNKCLFIDCSFRDCDLRETVFNDSKFDGCSFSGAFFTDAQFQNVEIQRCDFRGARIEAAQVKALKGWETAVLDDVLREALGVEAGPKAEGPEKPKK